MKKNFKKILLALVITGILATGSASAWSIHTLSVYLKNFCGTSNTPAKQKTVYAAQSVMTTRAEDSISGDDRAILVQTLDENGYASDWISANTNNLATWTTSQGNGNKNTGYYNLYIKAKKSTISRVTYEGLWYIDGQGY